MYWVGVDYLDLAAAAARCGAHFTALLYVEAWQEAAHGWLAPLDSTAPAASAATSAATANGSGGSGGRGTSGGGDGAAGGDKAEAVRRLLLDIYSQINEPDGIYAVVRSHSMLAQVGWLG